MWPGVSLCRVFPAEQMFWEVMQLRREMSFAKLGYYKDQLWLTDSPALQSPQTLPWSPALPLVLVFLPSSSSSSLLYVWVCFCVWENNCGCFQSSQRRLKDCDVCCRYWSQVLVGFCWEFESKIHFPLLKHVTLRDIKTSGMKREVKNWHMLAFKPSEELWPLLFFLPFKIKVWQGWNKSFKFLNYK